MQHIITSLGQIQTQLSLNSAAEGKYNANNKMCTECLSESVVGFESGRYLNVQPSQLFLLS